MSERSCDDVFVFPASFAQERLWFLEQLNPGSAVYNIPSAYRFPGPLNVVALERSLNEIVRRHEALRTTFSAAEGETVQIVASNLALPLRRIDLGEIPEGTREAEFARLVDDEAKRPFDLGTGPLVRATLIRLGELEHVMLVTLHHIVSDAWSSGIMFRERTVIYGAYAAGNPSPLPELPLQYPDFAQWQRACLQGETLEGHLAFWRQRLDAAPTLLELPADRPRPPAPTFRGATQSFALSGSVVDALRKLSNAEGATLFMTLLAGFMALLYRYTGETDIVVGAPIANRTRPEVEDLIGFFVNTLVLRADISPECKFRELIRRVRSAAIEAYAHQDLPFEKLVRELQPERQVAYNPLFQVMFAYQTAGPAESSAIAEAESASSSVPKVVVGTAKFDLTLFVMDAGRSLAGAIEYNTDLFDAVRIERMIAHLTRLLEGIASDPD